MSNLGGEPKANVTSKGSNDSPVYFDASGVAVPIAALSTAITSQDISGTIYKIGKTVMVTGTTTSKVGSLSASGAIPEGYRPIQQAYGYAFGINSTSASASPYCGGIVSINTSGSIRLETYGTNPGTSYYIRFTIVYISE